MGKWVFHPLNRGSVLKWRPAIAIAGERNAVRRSLIDSKTTSLPMIALAFSMFDGSFQTKGI
jgi:hypothetical protein